MNNRFLMETKNITDNLIHQIHISEDEKSVYLDVDFMNGKFKIEKVFQNSLIGLDQLVLTRSFLDSEEKVFRYLRIGENNVNKS